VKEIVDEPDHALAASDVLARMRPGDFVLLQTDEGASEPTINLVRRWIQQS